MPRLNRTERPSGGGTPGPIAAVIWLFCGNIKAFALVAAMACSASGMCAAVMPMACCPWGHESASCELAKVANAGRSAVTPCVSGLAMLAAVSTSAVTGTETGNAGGCFAASAAHDLAAAPF